MCGYLKKDIKSVQPEEWVVTSSNTAGLGETFNLLTHPYRRYVLHYPRTDSEVVAIDTLTPMLANELEGPSATAGSRTTELSRPPSIIRTSRNSLMLASSRLPRIGNRLNSTR